MAFLLKELVFMTILASALTFPWKPNGMDSTVDFPPGKDIYPVETDKRGMNSTDDEPPIEEYPVEDKPSGSKRSEVENIQAREKAISHFLNRRRHVLPAPDREEVYPLETISAKRAPAQDNNYRESRIDENKNSKRGSVSNTYRWPISSSGSVDISYYFDSSLNSDAQKWAKTVIHQLSQDTCINLVEGTEGNHEVTFIAGSGCSSLIGHQQDTQTIILGSGCQFRGTIAHEIMHLLGFFHEHTRLDRDQYITVYEENILDGFSSQFNTRSQNNFGYSYDKHSIMQYGKTAFGITLSDGTKATTMESISDSSETLGAVSHMNANDLGKINDFYDCSSAPTFVDHTITLSTQENSLFSCCHGTDGYVYVKLVGNSGTTPWQLVTSGGKLYADENEGGDVQTHNLPFPNVGPISSVKVALEDEGDIKTRKRRSLGTKTKRLFDGWTLEDLTLDGVSYGGGELDVGEELTLTA